MLDLILFLNYSKIELFVTILELKRMIFMKPYEKLKDMRIKKGITTYELSELTGIPQSTISKMENGKRKIEVEELSLLANALNVPEKYFFESTEVSLSSPKNKTTDELDPEVRAIARNIQNFDKGKRKLLNDLVEQLIKAGDDEIDK